MVYVFFSGDYYIAGDIYFDDDEAWIFRFVGAWGLGLSCGDFV